METRMNFFLERYKKLGEVVEPFEPKTAIRINTIKTSEKPLLNRLRAKGCEFSRIPFVQNGYFVEKAKFSLGATEEYLLGDYFLQEAASQVPAEVLAPEKNDVVLDCCAAPGGKTTHLAQLMENKGMIISLEMKSQRIQSLKNNLERIGAANTIVYNLDCTNALSLGVQFDKILLDAPCSGNLIVDKDWLEKRSIDGIRKSAEIQKRLIGAALSVLKKDGILVYSTCSLEPEENELNIDWMLRNYKVKLEKIEIDAGSGGLTTVFGQKLDKEVSKCLRFWPNRNGTQGFFIAKVRKC